MSIVQSHHARPFFDVRGWDLRVLRGCLTAVVVSDVGCVHRASVHSAPWTFSPSSQPSLARANLNAMSAPFDERQAALRMELRARLNSQFRLVRAVHNAARGLLSGSPGEADLDKLRTYLNAKKRRFMVPTSEQIEVVIKSIDSASAALAVAHHHQGTTPPSSRTWMRSSAGESARKH